MWKVEWVITDERYSETFVNKAEADEFVEKLETFGYDYLCYELKNLKFDELIRFCWENRVTDTFFSVSGLHILEFEDGNFKEKIGSCNIGRFEKFKMG